MSIRLWPSAQAVLAALIVLAFLQAAVLAPRTGLGYILIVGAACIVAWRLRVGTSLVIPGIGAILLLVLAFTPPLMNLALCANAHICRTPSSIEAARGLSLMLGLVWSAGLAVAFGSALKSRAKALAAV